MPRYWKTIWRDSSLGWGLLNGIEFVWVENGFQFCLEFGNQIWLEKK
jgi:hypothetical protein